MSNLVQQLQIRRVCKDGCWISLLIVAKVYGDWTGLEIKNDSNLTEDEALSSILDDFVQEFGSENLRSNINEGFLRLRERDLYNNIQAWLDIPIVVDEQVFDHHYSCNEANKEYSDTQASTTTDISYSELKEKLATLDKESTIYKLFKDNKCPVCISSYKEIVIEDLHIVISSCGHPSCCKCADNILSKMKKECPLCRSKIDKNLFKLLKFNEELQIENKDRTAFFS